MTEPAGGTGAAFNATVKIEEYPKDEPEEQPDEAEAKDEEQPDEAEDDK